MTDLPAAILAATLPDRAAAIKLNPQQEERDRRGLGCACAACGRDGAERDPLVIASDGYRVHVSHVLGERDGYFGVPFAATGAAA